MIDRNEHGTDHRLVLVERSRRVFTPDETVMELTVRHGQCACCKRTLYDKDEALVLATAHVDGSYNMQRFCSVNCVIFGLHGYDGRHVAARGE